MPSASQPGYLLATLAQSAEQPLRKRAHARSQHTASNGGFLLSAFGICAFL
jgi:hypothetical protein